MAPGPDPGSFILDGSGSSDPDQDALTFHWSWVLGNSTTQESKIQVDFPEAVVKGNAAYLVTLTVVDEGGQRALALNGVSFGSGSNRDPKIAVKDATRWVKPNTEVLLDASLSTDPDGDARAYEWYWGPLSDYNPAAEPPHDACGQVEQTLNIFTTACLGENQSFNLTFDKPGTYNYHCHPHPFMKARLVVDASLPRGDAVTIEMSNYRYSQDVTKIGVGTTVRFINRDPGQHKHTATVEDYLPGTTPAGNTPIFRQTLASGDYVVRLVLTDGKGGRATQSWGLRASDTAPSNPQVNATEHPDPMVPNTVQNVNYNTSFTYDIHAQLEWNDPTSTAEMELTLGSVAGNQFAPVSGCEGKRGGVDDSNKVIIQCKIIAQNYVFKVNMKTGTVLDWKLTVTGIPYSNPGFGDSGAGGGHH